MQLKTTLLFQAKKRRMTMLKYFRHGIMASLVSVSALTASTTALANDNQPTRLVVGFSPGGAADVLARSLAEWVHEYTGNVYIVENRPGASARRAWEHAYQATRHWTSNSNTQPRHPLQSRPRPTT